MEKRRCEQLDLRERIEIYRLHADGKSLRFIAGAVERNVATLSRELKCNSKASKKWPGGYDPQRAQELMLRRHARGRAHKLERQPELRKEVVQRLAEGWSPEQIAGRMAQRPTRQRISYESIYRYIYWRTWSFKETLHRLLPRQKGGRGKRFKNGRWSSASILERVSIGSSPLASMTAPVDGYELLLRMPFNTLQKSTPVFANWLASMKSGEGTFVPEL